MGCYEENPRITCLQRICSNIIFRISFVFFLSACLCVFIPAIVYHASKEEAVQSCRISHEYQTDCLPHIPIENQTRQDCDKVSKHCCWNSHVFLNFPRCYYKLPPVNYYTGTIVNNSFATAQIVSNFADDDSNLASMKNFSVIVEQWNNTHLHIKINGENQKTDHPICKKESGPEQQQPFKVVYKDDAGRLYLNVKRPGVKDRVLFDTRIGPLIFTKDYIEISSLLPSNHIYGLGQSRKRKLGVDLKYSRRWNLYSRYRTNETTETHWPGVHPFYLCMEEDGLAHGLLVATNRPIEIVTTEGPMISFRIMGGNLDLHFFLGPSPDMVISQMLKCVGEPVFPPYWALGHHICRSSFSEIMSLTTKLREKSIEQESACITSTYDEILKENKEQLKSFLDILHENNQKLIIVQTPQITSEKFKSKFKEFYVKDPSDNNTFYGHLSDNTKVFYPDFLNPKILSLMTEHYDELRVESFDGFLLDINTPLNKNNEKCEKSDLHTPGGIDLSDGTLCWNSLHYNQTKHYSIHNMYGHKHLETISDYLSQRRKRLLLITMSTFPGSGRQGGHWGGLNFATWEDLQQAAVDMLEYNIYGIPLSGSPYCGSYGDLSVDQKLCSRWLQLSALSPLMIGLRGAEEESVDLLNNTLIASVGKMVLRLRYSLLPYFYTLFYKAHVHGRTVMRPLFFEFQNDKETYHLDGQFMIGSALLVSPVLIPDKEKIEAYFPKGCWYSYYDGRQIEKIYDKGEKVELSAIESHINLHVLGGHIIPGRTGGLTVTQSQKENYTLTIALSCQNESILAKGELYIDDGESRNSEYVLVRMKLENDFIGRTYRLITWVDVRTSSYPDVSFKLEIIRLFGMKTKVEKADVLRFRVNGGIWRNATTYKEQFVFEELTLDLRQNNSIMWNYYT